MNLAYALIAVPADKALDHCGFEVGGHHFAGRLGVCIRKALLHAGARIVSEQTTELSFPSREPYTHIIFQALAPMDTLSNSIYPAIKEIASFLLLSGVNPVYCECGTPEILHG